MAFRRIKNSESIRAIQSSQFMSRWPKGAVAETCSSMAIHRSAANAEYAILVSDVLPGGTTAFAQIEGVWVCSRSQVIPLALALRAGIIEVANARKAADGHGEKSELVYNYLCSAEFQHHVSGLAESFSEMLSDLSREEAAMQRIWKKRRKQLK